jgi:hypothetical protein
MFFTMRNKVQKPMRFSRQAVQNPRAIVLNFLSRVRVNPYWRFVGVIARKACKTHPHMQSLRGMQNLQSAHDTSTYRMSMKTQ